jgi:hypothetical protein
MGHSAVKSKRFPEFAAAKSKRKARLSTPASGRDPRMRGDAPSLRNQRRLAAKAKRGKP